MPRSPMPRAMRAVASTVAVVGLVAGSVILSVSGSAIAASTARPAASTTGSGAEYVALGDSYAAGYGLSDPTEQPVAGCSQSAHDYPHRVAQKLGLDLTDVTCAGATTADVIDREQLGAAPQIEALSTRTRLVTISIGGNDADLFGTASSCIALSAKGPVISQGDTTSCRSNLVKGGNDTLSDAVEGPVASGLAQAFSAIRERAPHAAVVVVGYPSIFPDRSHTPPAGCFRPVVTAKSFFGTFPRDGFPFTDTDTSYLRGIQVKLDAVTRAAADRPGFRYVSTLDASDAHSACADKGSYVEGITLKSTSHLRSISLVSGALHPNEAGTAFLADRAATAARAALAPTPTPSAAVTPAGGGVELLWIAAAVAFLVVVALLLVVRRRRRRRPPPSQNR